jgi:hypothetical protein
MNRPATAPTSAPAPAAGALTDAGAARPAALPPLPQRVACALDAELVEALKAIARREYRRVDGQAAYFLSRAIREALAAEEAA